MTNKVKEIFALTDAGASADQHQRALHDAAAQNQVQFAILRADTRYFFDLDLADLFC